MLIDHEQIKGSVHLGLLQLLIYNAQTRSKLEMLPIRETVLPVPCQGGSTCILIFEYSLLSLYV